jgi:hypothetical protein
MEIHNTNCVKPAAQEAEERSDTQVYIYIYIYIYKYSLAILSSQIDVCAAALTQAQTHKKRETEKATKQ